MLPVLSFAFIYFIVSHMILPSNGVLEQVAAPFLWTSDERTESLSFTVITVAQRYISVNKAIAWQSKFHQNLQWSCNA